MKPKEMFFRLVIAVAFVSIAATAQASKEFKSTMKNEIGPAFKAIFVDVMKVGKITEQTQAASLALVAGFMKVQNEVPQYRIDRSKPDGMREATLKDQQEFKAMNADMLTHAQNLAAFISKNDIASAKAELGQMNQLRESAHDAFKGE